MIRSVITAAVAVLVVGAGTARADFVNGGFETGNFSGFTTIGNVNVVPTLGGIAPPSGGFQARIANQESFAPEPFPNPALPALSQAALTTFLGLPANALTALGNGVVTEGSAIAQNVVVSAGDVLTFNYNFLTDETFFVPPFNDFAFLSITSVPGPGGPGAIEIVDVLNSGPPFTPALGSGYLSQTGYRTFTFTFATSGTFRIGFGVVDVTDIAGDSALLLDNLRVGPGGPAVPEPAGLALAGLGAAALIGYRRRKVAGAA